jgi:hypothetical protein
VLRVAPSPAEVVVSLVQSAVAPPTAAPALPQSSAGPLAAGSTTLPAPTAGSPLVSR